MLLETCLSGYLFSFLVFLSGWLNGLRWRGDNPGLFSLFLRLAPPFKAIYIDRRDEDTGMVAKMIVYMNVRVFSEKHETGDKHRPVGPLGSYTDLTL